MAPKGLLLLELRLLDHGTQGQIAGPVCDPPLLHNSNLPLGIFG